MRHPAPSPSATVAKVLMWAFWVLWVNGSFFFAFFLTRSKLSAPVESPQGLVTASVIILPFALAMALRFWLIPRIRNPWVQLLPYIVGVVLSQQILLLGIFILRGEHRVVFCTLCAVAMLCYLPYGIRPRPIAPAPVA